MFTELNKCFDIYCWHERWEQGLWCSKGQGGFFFFFGGRCGMHLGIFGGRCGMIISDLFLFGFWLSIPLNLDWNCVREIWEIWLSDDYCCDCCYDSCYDWAFNCLSFLGFFWEGGGCLGARMTAVLSFCFENQMKYNICSTA